MIVAAAGPSEQPRDSRRLRDYIDAVGGGRICCDHYRPAGGTPYTNLILRWENGAGHGGEKRLVTPASTRAFGRIELVAFLHAYRGLALAGDPRILASARAQPPAREVAHQVDRDSAAFDELCNHLGMQGQS